jgi:TolB protein
MPTNPWVPWTFRVMAFALAGALAVVMLVQLGAQEPALPAGEELDTRIFVCQPDGSGMKLLVEKTEYRMQGSPTWSQDGKLIAFDAWRPALEEKNTDSKIIIVNADGGDLKVLGDGAMPSFSPRHQRIAFSRYHPNNGVWVMSIEGPEKELILLDEKGWGADWSPDGKRIAYALYEDTGSNFAVFDVVEGERTLLFEEGKSPYSNFHWNFAWSPDGRYIAFKGQRVDNEKFELVICDARGAKHGLITRVDGEVTPNIGWSHDSKRVLFSQKTASRANRVQLYAADADNKEPPHLLAGQDPLRANVSAAISPDGSKLLVVSRKLPPAKNNPAKGKAKKTN